MTHTVSTTLDHQRGGWCWSCSCGKKAKRPSWYKARSLAEGEKHIEAKT